MKAHFGIALALSLFPISTSNSVAVFGAANEGSATFVSGEDLREDLKILDRALSTLHPGLYRYADATELQAALQELDRELTSGASLSQTYLAISRFLARIKCGHTYANFWNQSDQVQSELFDGRDKVPFTFEILDGRMFVLDDATSEGGLRRGSEIVSMNGREVSEILEGLRQLVKADGSNDGKRLYDLQVTGIGRFESFDVYQPLAFPPAEGRYELQIIPPGSDESVVVNVAAVTREHRKILLRERYGEQPAGPDDLWTFELLDETTAHLRLGSFVTWKMTLDWKEFLRDSFESMRRAEVTDLILDLRGNEGGDDEVNRQLANYLVTKPVDVPVTRELLRYAKVPADLNPYLETWDDSFRDLGDAVVPVGEGFFARRDASAEPIRLQPGPQAFEGQVYVLVDAANSSATHVLASILKEGQLATLIGQTTGGNCRGINGGQMFFLRLPHSHIEVDVPLIGYYRGVDQPDAGLSPDVVVERTPRHLIEGIDAELAAARRLVAESHR